MRILYIISIALNIFFLTIVSAQPRAQRTEIIEKRTGHSKTFLKADGSYELEISQSYQHYEDENGKQQEIDSRFEAADAGNHKVERGRFKVYLNERNRQKAVRFATHQDKEITFEIESMGLYNPETRTYKVLEEVGDVKGVIRGNTAVYKNIFKDVDIRYTYLADRLKEDIILGNNARKRLSGYERGSYLMFKIRYTHSSGLTPFHKVQDITGLDYQTEGWIDYKDENGNYQFTLPGDLARYESTDGKTDPDYEGEIAVLKRFYREGDTSYILAGVPLNWVESLPGGKVIIDPTIMLKDANSQDAPVWWCSNSQHAYSSTTNYGSAPYLLAHWWTHSSLDRRRFFIQFDLNSLPANARLTDATMVLTNDGNPHSNNTQARYSVSSTYIQRVIQPWDESDITWNNQAQATATNQVSVPAPLTGYDSMVVNVTSLVRDILASPEGNNGFLVKMQTESTYRGVRYASNNNTSYKHPELKISYTEMQKNYYLKDHLGNIRVTIDEDGDVVTTDDYYPFGMRMPGRSYNVAFSGNQYKYNSKELDDENNLNWHYYGARYYDAKVARWTSMDPLEDKFPENTPYNYVLNNPQRMVDFDGKIAWDQSVRHTRVSSNFGKRIHPITNKFTGHTGIDMATNGTGHSVKALAEGTVRKVGWDSRAENGKTVGYGRYVVIEHDQGYFSLYGHLDKQSVKFKEGQKVFNGQIIAKSGNTGGSTAPHLHLEIAKGTKLADVFNKANKIDPKTIGDLQHLIDRSNVTFTFSSTQTNTTSTSQSMLQSVNNSKWGYGPSPQEMWDKMNGN